MTRPGFILSLIMLLSSLVVSNAATPGGMAFRSYESPVRDRTSLSFGDKHGEMSFRDSLSLDFLMRIDPEREPFGSICHILTDSSNILNLVLIHDRDKAPGMIVNLGTNISKPLSLDHSLNELNRISLGIKSVRDSLRFYANGVLLASCPASGRKHTVRIVFGTSSGDITDIAPIILYEVSLRRDGSRADTWNFESAWQFAQIAQKGPRMMASVSNPLWKEEQDARWQRGPSFQISVPFRLAYGDSSAGVTFVSANEIVRFHPERGEAQRYPFQDTLPIEAMGDDFIQEPDGGLYIIDLEAARPSPNRFDFETLHWERQERREAYSRSFEAALLRNPIDGSIVRLFGYGYHRFLNEMVRWQSGEETVKTELDGAEPRRRAVFCVRDSLVFIYGGDGNESGRQDLPIRFYPEILTLNLSDYSVQKVAISEAVPPASPDLIYHEGRFNLLAFDSGNIVLVGIDPETGICRKSPVLVSGMTVYWGSRLLRAGNCWFVCLAGVAPGGNGLVKCFSIKDPFREVAPVVEKRRPWWPWLLLSALVLGALAFVIMRRRRLEPVFTDESADESSPDTRQIRLLGFFKVSDRSGQDLTKEFSPMMQQVLAFLLLNCREDGRVSNAQLRENLWFDKSEESFNNNRAVYFNRIRAQLEKLGSVAISNSAGNWTMELSDVPCDYYRALELAESVQSGLADQSLTREFVHLAGKGPLLPEIEAEWLDRFKAEYAEKMITALSALSQHPLSASDRILLGELILGFDSLDEEAVRMKCGALMESKRYGAAQDCYKAFVQRYVQMMGEEFRTPFSDFIKK